MIIHIFYNTLTVESPLAAYAARTKYFGQFDSDNNINEVTLHDCSGLNDAAVHNVIYAIAAASAHRVIVLNNGAGASQVSNAHVTDLEAKLIGSATDDLSDDKVIVVPIAAFDTALVYGRNQAQNLWNALYGYKECVPLKQGFAASGGNFTLTSAGTPFVLNAYAGYWLHIISGTGAGQFRKIVSNTTSAITVDTAWTLNPAANSVYYVTPHYPKPLPFIINYIGGGSSMMNTGTASGGTTDTLIDAGIGWTTNAYAGMYVYVIDGTNKGQSSAITSNNTTTLVLTTPMTSANDGTTVYIIVSHQFEVLWYEYVNRWAWVYGYDLASDVQLGYLAKLFNNDSQLNDKQESEPASMDYDFWENDVIAKGKAIFDNISLAAPPLLPTPL